MADNYLITGYWGEPHVTAENDRGINAAIFGTGRFVLPVGERFNAEYIGNNTIRMYDGKLMNNGAAGGIPVGEHVDLLIANAGQGMKRNDMIVFQYEQDASTLVESGRFVVIQGTETSGTASDPELTQQDLLSGDATFDQMALWRVSVSGTTISAPVKLFSMYDQKDAGAYNLLDNTDLPNCVNQRGSSSYSGVKYGFDRWMSTSGYCTVAKTTTGLNIKSTDGTNTAYLIQFIEDGKVKSGKKYTAACTLTDGSIHCVSAEANVGMSEAVTYIYVDNVQLGTIRFKYDTGKALYGVLFSTLSTSGMDIVNVALYEGEYTSETLPTYVAKGYTAELAECMRYYQVGQSIILFNNGASSIAPGREFLVPMRIKPTLTIYGGGNFDSAANYIGVWGKEKDQAVKTISYDQFRIAYVQGNGTLSDSRISYGYIANADL